MVASSNHPTVCTVAAGEEFCCQHKKDGMVDVKSKRCGQQGCTKLSTHGVDGCGRRQFCREHKKDGMVNVLKRCGQQGCTLFPSFGVMVAPRESSARITRRTKW